MVATILRFSFFFVLPYARLFVTRVVINRCSSIDVASFLRNRGAARASCDQQALMDWLVAEWTLCCRCKVAGKRRVVGGTSTCSSTEMPAK